MVVSNIYCFRPTKTILGKIWFKKSKLSAEAEIWYLNNFEYVDFNGDNVHFFCFRAEITFLGKLVLKNWNCLNYQMPVLPSHRNQSIDFHSKWVKLKTVCYYHVTHEFQSESRLYSLPESQGAISEV